MNSTRTMLTVVISLVLVLSALPAAAVSYNSKWGVDRKNSGGSTFVNMTSTNTTFCYLSRVLVEETDITGEYAGCRLTRGSVVWTLEAIVGTSSDADAYCSAICYNN